jgi:hypothetical protein
VMRVDAAHPPELVVGEPAVQGRRHLADAGVPFPLQGWVDQAPVRGPRLLDEPRPAVGVRLVPRGQVGVDDRQACSPPDRRVRRATKPLPGESTRVTAAPVSGSQHAKDFGTVSGE